MNYIDFLGVLTKERLLLEKSWSATTAYPGSAIGDLNKSVGQCFVTSSLLYFYLKEFPVKNKFSIKRGIVLDKNNNMLLTDHCWVEMIDTRNQELIIDLTLDQCKKVKEKVVYSNKDFIFNKLGLYYFASREYIYQSYHEIENENARKRYVNLISNKTKALDD